MSASEDAGDTDIRAVRTMRSLRLIKLVRLAKSSRVISRAMEYVSLSSTSQTAVGLVLQSLLLTHWFACILVISTTFQSPRGTWLFTYGYCSSDDEEFVETSAADKGEDDEGGWACVNMGYLYLKAWWWGMGLIFHNTIPMIPADGPFTPSFVAGNVYRTTFNDDEDRLLIVLKLLGIGVRQ